MAKKKSVISTRRIEIEAVTKSHRTPCKECVKSDILTPPQCMPVGRRLLIIFGSGKFQKREVYCMEHGRDWLTEFGDQIRDVQGLLTGTMGS